MSLTERRRAVRISINGTPVKFVDYSVTESLDNLCTVAEFQLAELPFPEVTAGDADTPGDTVLIEWIEIHDTPIAYALFGGTISAIDTASEPWLTTIRCVDQLELLRKIKNGSDMDLTGMTDGEAIMALLDYCGIDYDPADIADTGYVLGERTDVTWKADGTTPASSVAGELNRVFRMSLFTIENNRVIRVPYDPTPDNDTGLFDEFEKGVSIDFNAHSRTKGDRDRVQNVWVVHGPAVENSTNTCTSTVWARSEYGSLLIGSSRRARIAAQEFQSDLIQDEELAEQIVRSQMQLTNRLPDDGSATLALNPNMHQCCKISIIDPTYGIRADPRYFLVRSVTKSGTGMTLELSAGPGGNDGTVTHGVDKVCNDTHSDIDWPGDFEFPPADFPPFDEGYELPDFALPEPFGGLDITGGTPEALPIIYCDSEAYANGVSIESGDWQISGILTLTSASQRLTIGVTTDDGDYRLTIAGPAYYAALSSPALRYEMATPDTVRSNVGVTPQDLAISWLLRWTEANKVLQCQVETTDFLIDDFAPALEATMGGAETIASVSGSPTRASETIEHNCSDEPPPGPGGACFVPLSANWNLTPYSILHDVGEVDFADGSESPETILIDPAPLADDEQITFSAHVEFSGPGNGTTDQPLASFIVTESGTPNGFAGVQVEWSSVTNDGWIYLYGLGSGFSQQNITDADLYVGFDINIIWLPAANTVSYALDNGTTTYNASVDLDTIPGDMDFRMNWTSSSVLAMDVTNIDICVGATEMLVGNWVSDSVTGSQSFGDGYVHTSGFGSAHNTANWRSAGEDWTLTATVVINSGHSTEIKMGVNGLANEYYALMYSTDAGGGLEVGSLNDTNSDSADLTGQTVTVTLAYDYGLQLLTATFDGSGAPIIISTTTDDASFPPALPLYPSVRVYEETPGGGASVDDMVLS